MTLLCHIRNTANGETLPNGTLWMHLAAAIQPMKLKLFSYDCLIKFGYIVSIHCPNRLCQVRRSCVARISGPNQKLLVDRII
jgi:hypothetical protein